MRALVTGVTRGIGRALVDHLVSAGASVVAVGRRADALGALADAWGPAVEPYVADATDRDALAAVAGAAGQIDLAVANAGALTAPGPVWESDPHEWWRGVEANLGSAHATARAVLPGMVGRGAGRLVLVTSGIGNAPGPWASSYAASKAGVTVLGASLELELAGTGVHCFLVSPGMVRTDMTRWPAALTRFRPELGDLPDEAFTPVSLFLSLVDDIASGRLDRLAGRFLHATDDRDRLMAEVGADDPRPRTLRLAAAYEGDPLAR